MREGPADGDQDLNFWTREFEDVVREIMEYPVFKGNQKYSFEMDLDEAGPGKRLFGGEANTGVWHFSRAIEVHTLSLSVC
jgi:hypothetical protein